MNNPEGEVIAGFPEFWQEAHDVQPDLFQALHDLKPLATKLFAQPEQGLLHRVLCHLAVAVSNSFGAVVTLCLNGYGADAVRIGRSMFEGAITARYLKPASSILLCRRYTRSGAPGLGRGSRF